MPFLEIKTGKVWHRAPDANPELGPQVFGPGSTIEITTTMVPFLQKHGVVTDHDPRLAAAKEVQAQAAFDQRQAELDRKAEELAVWEKNLKAKEEAMAPPEVKVVDEAKAAEERYLSQTKSGSIKGNK